MLHALRERAAPLLLIGLLFGLLILMSAQVTSGENTLLERSIFWVFSPVVRSFSGTAVGIGDLWTHYVDLRGARSESP